MEIKRLTRIVFLTSGIFIIAIRNDNNDLNDFTLSRFILCVLGSFDL